MPKALLIVAVWAFALSGVPANAGTCNDGEIDTADCAGECEGPWVSSVSRDVINGVIGMGNARLVWTGRGYGVAWIDGTAADHVYFRVLDIDGGPVTSPIQLSVAANANGVVAAWNGTHFAVTWTQGGAVHISLVDEMGVLQSGPDTVASSAQVPSPFPPSQDLDWNGHSFVLLYVAPGAEEDTTELFFRTLSAAGQPMGDPVPVTSDGADKIAPRLAVAESGYGVVWTTLSGAGPGGTFFAVLSESGEPQVVQPLQPAASSSSVPHVVWTGSGFGAMWLDGSVTSDIPWFASFDANGLPASVPILLHAYSLDLRYASFDLVWTGKEFGALWSHSTSGFFPYLTRIASNGSLIEGPVSILRGDFAYLTGTLREVIWNGSGFSWLANADLGFIDCDCHVRDDDGDQAAKCADCDDDDPDVYPGAPEICDEQNNDCDHPGWPSWPDSERDLDRDGWSACAGDCDDEEGDTFPDAPELCDGINNDCSDPRWPEFPLAEQDIDEDGVPGCAGDCNDENPWISPLVAETCNAIDDDCNGFVDDGPAGEDSDFDGIHDVCDNCAGAFNPGQQDTDADGLGNGCDNCLLLPNSDQHDLDSDGRGDLCDNCIETFNSFQDDLDGDGSGDACDNCVFESNSSQSDTDDDFEGDHCDLDDGLIYILVSETDFLEWQNEVGFEAWNPYRGSLDVLVETGAYTQAIGSTPLADRVCGVGAPLWHDVTIPEAGQVAYYLVSGVSGGFESGLGVDGSGGIRPNDNPCP